LVLSESSFLFKPGFVLSLGQILIAPHSRIGFPFRSLLHAIQLVPPETLECARPLVEWPDRACVGSIQHPAAVASDVDESNIEEDTQVLRDGWLLKTQGRHYVPDRALLQSEIVQDLSPAGLGDGIEHIRSGSCTRHGEHYIPIWAYVKHVFLLGMVLEDGLSSRLLAAIAGYCFRHDPGFIGLRGAST
jgi:hypothetical protein